MLTALRSLWWIGFGTLVPVQLAVLALLPYSTSVIHRGTIDTRTPPDSQGNFALGALDFPVSSFARDPALSDFRAYYGRWCAGQVGLDAALCVSNRFSEQFPYGNPSQDVFSPDYDPHATLVAHTVRGEPGHCVTRAGLAVAVLLSAGIPSRVVQIVFPTGAGHTVLSVWDEKRGWVFFDPLYGGTLESGDRFVSIQQAIDPAVSVTWRSLGTPAVDAPEEERVAFYRDEALDQASVLYPEPWFYLRSGPHVASWPYRGAFHRIGSWQWWIGPAQLALMIGIALAAVVFVARGLRATVAWFGTQRLAARSGPQPQGR